MLNTDNPDYVTPRPGVMINKNEAERVAYLRQRALLAEKAAMQTQINNMQTDIDTLKNLVQQLLAKE